MAAVTKIHYDADLVGVHPATQTGSGYKMDHNAYSVVVNLSADLLAALNAQKGSGTLVYRFDAYDAAGEYIRTEESALGSLTSIEFEITKPLTRVSGNIRIIPIITSVSGSLTVFEKRLGIITALVKATPESEDDEYKDAISLSTLERAAKEAAATALAAKADCLAAQEATEAARFALEGYNTTVIFDGGDAESEFPVNIVVDDFLSENRMNPVTARKIAQALQLFETNIKSWVSNTYSISALMAAVKQEIYAEEYPVGSVKVSFDPEYNPNGILPGTWELIGGGRSIICAGTDDESGEVFEVGDTGGEATHTLTVDEMPRHKHSVDPFNILYNYGYELGGNHNGDILGDQTATGAQFTSPAHNTNSTGNSQPHNNRSPYIVANIWRRVEDETEE